MQTHIVEKRDYLTASEMWKACLKHWWWFVISVIIMMSLAYVFYRKSIPIYVRSASLMVLNTANCDRYKYSDLKVRGLGIETSKAKLVNEIDVLRSPAMMKQVVEKLHLDVEYRKPGEFFNQLVYGDIVPVNVFFADESLSGEFFKLNLYKDGKIMLSEFSGHQQDSIRIKGQIGDTITTPLGKVFVEAKHNYEDLCNATPALWIHKNLSKDVSIKIIKGIEVENARIWTDVVRMTLIDESPDRAEAILNTLMRVYDDEAMRIHSRRAEQTVTFLQSRVQDLTNRLNNIDNSIAAYKGTYLISDVETNQGIYFKQSYEQAGMINRHSAQLAALRYVQQNMLQNMGTNKYIPTDIGIENYEITKQISNYNALQTERNDLAASTGVGNPAVIDLDRQLDIYRNTILSTIEHTTNVMETQLEGLEVTAEGIDANMANSAHHEMTLISKGRMRRLLEELYAFLYFQKERNAIALSHNVSTIRVMQTAFGPSHQLAPLKTQIMVMGFFGGLIIPFVFIFFLTISDDKVYLRTDLMGFQVPLLGDVPSMEKKLSWFKKEIRNKKVHIYIDNKSRDSFNESMRMLRTNLEFIHQGKDGNMVVMMTSSVPNCGKSFVSSNLAACISLVGKKVILVDLDMRKATVSTLIKDANRGASSYLSYSENDLDKLIRKDAFFEGVDLLPVGSLPPNPTELLQSSRLAELINTLKSKYECIIIDCPPVDIVADDDLINVFADVTIYVMKAGLTNLDMLTEANELYAEKRFRNMCAVLNGVKHLKGGSNHYYGSLAKHS
ncbi:MAG: polysaccharide biosynthesis tyrosine autokinase [Paludibacteraceae bacterium]|nr:polysaccharide biosynthesis tyrosine autokinase [Paludibacteraceae bacterium]